MNWKGPFRKAGERVRVGRRTINVPGVPSMTDLDRPTPASGPADDSDQPPADFHLLTRSGKAFLFHQAQFCRVANVE